jgi:hypothetical protein
MNENTIKALLEKFSDLRFHPQLELLTWHPRGTLDGQLIDDLLLLLQSEEFDGKGLVHRVYTDFTYLDRIHLNLDHFFRFAEGRQTASSPRKSAVFANSLIGFGVAQLYQHFMRNASFRVRAFRDRGEAAAWLGVPVEIFKPEWVES